MLNIDLTGKIAFVAGLGDDKGYGWAIAKRLSEAGATIIAGTWPPVYDIFTKSLSRGKLDTKCADGSTLEITEVFALDAAFDNMDDVPADIKENKRYAVHPAYTISDVAKAVEEKYGKVDILIHALANGPEVKNDLLETSRAGYLAAFSSSSYSMVSLVQHFSPIMNEGGSVVSLTYLSADRTIPGYGGGMGAAKAIGFIGKMIDYSEKNSPLTQPFIADHVATSAAFICSPLASAITGSTMYVDNGLHTMGIGPACVED